MKKSLMIMTLTGILLGGCVALDKTNEAVDKVSNATKTAQTMVNINSIKGVEYTLEGSNQTITFENGKVYGFSGINRYFGGLKTGGDSIEITNLASTMMAGSPEEMKKESEFLKALGEVNKMTIADNVLVLSNETKQLKFIAK